jgi:predicted hydrocarbon binding protein
MKGIIFRLLNQMVEDRLGLEVWTKILEKVNPHSGGVYTTAGTYPDEELLSLVGELSQVSGKPAEQLVYAFGEYMLPQLAKAYPGFFEGMAPKPFLLSIHDVIHVEVKKLYPDADLPTIEYENPAADRLVMKYQSPRKLCRLAEGLIDGTAKHFDTKIRRKQTKCLLQGDDHCRFELSFE